MYRTLVAFCFFSIVFCFIYSQSAFAKECNPQSPTTFIFKKEIQYFYISGNVATFDPCHKSVDFKNIDKKKKKPLVILIHGGSGKKDTGQISSFLRSNNFATLELDAYQMNGITDYNQSNNSRKYSNATRQRMIYSAFKGAVDWSMKQEGIDSSRIYIYGISNGATVAANLAAVYDQSIIKAVISEGPTHSGMGMPDEIKTKLILVFGKLDNFGATKKDGWRWIFRSPCFMSISIEDAPKGNTFNCNTTTQSGDGLVENHITWFNKQKKKNKNIEIYYYDDAAHGIFHPGGLKISSMVFKRKEKEITIYWNTGAKPEALKKFKKDLLTFVN